MSNYVVTTNFLSKDGLISGNPLKLVKGADLTVEFNAIAAAIATKDDIGGAITPTTGTFSGLLTANLGLIVAGAGVQLGAPTGGDKGVGTINAASGVLINGVSVAATLKTKASTTSRNTTTTLTNDPDLTLALAAAGTYKIEIGAGLQCNVGGLAMTVNYSGTITSSIQVGAIGGIITPATNNISATVNNPLFNSGTTGNLGGGSIGVGVLISATLTVSTAGTVALSWAQSLSSGNNTSLLPGSWMCVTRLA